MCVFVNSYVGYWFFSWSASGHHPVSSCLLSIKQIGFSTAPPHSHCWWVLANARSNQSSINEINPPYSLEGLKLKLQSFGHLMWTAHSLEKTLMLGKIEGRRRRGRQKMTWLDGITALMGMSLSKLQERGWRAGKSGVLQFMGWWIVRHDLATEQQHQANARLETNSKMKSSDSQARPYPDVNTQEGQVSVFCRKTWCLLYF